MVWVLDKRQGWDFYLIVSGFRGREHKIRGGICHVKREG